MRVLVHLVYDPTGKEAARVIEVPSESSIADLLNCLALPMADIEHERYYLIDDGVSWFNLFPFVSVGNKIRWYQDYQGTKLIDFLKTHGIGEAEIYIRWWPQPFAGGFWPYEVNQLWEHFYEFVKNVDPILFLPPQ
jgi:hypothetical protein